MEIGFIAAGHVIIVTRHIQYDRCGSCDPKNKTRFSSERYNKNTNAGSTTENLQKLSPRWKKEKTSRRKSSTKSTGSSGT